MTLTDLLVAFPPRQLLAIAIGLSIVLYASAANAAWRLADATPRPGRLFGWLASLRGTWVPRVLGELGRWLYYIGLPYATLMLGFNTVRALGVWNLDWLGSLPMAGLLGAGAVAVTAWVWRPYARSQHPHAVDTSRWNWARHIIELIYQQAHWAFYRSGPILWLGDFYLGSFMGLALALLEGWSNPNVRKSVRDVTRADAPLWSGSLAVVSTVMFIYTQNFWYCLAVHLLLDSGLRTAIGFPPVPALEEESAMHLNAPHSSE